MLGEHGLLKEVTQRLVERAPAAELTNHLGDAPPARTQAERANTRNGTPPQRAQTEPGPEGLTVPRDGAETFEPTVVPKRQRRGEGLAATVPACYAHGLTTRERQSYLEDLYDTEVSPLLSFTITNATLDDVRLWQSRPLESVYPILSFDCLVVQSRHEGAVKPTAVYVALGVTLMGEQELLGLWVSATAGANVWLAVLTELLQRGVQDCCVACVDGVAGLPEARETIFPQPQVQLCLVPKVRQALGSVGWQERRSVVREHRAISRTSTLETAEEALGQLAQIWDANYPTIRARWRRAWTRLTVFFDAPPAIRTVLSLSNAIESLNFSGRQVLKKRGALPTHEAIVQVRYRGMPRIAKKWTMPIPEWKRALNQFAILLGDHVPASD